MQNDGPVQESNFFRAIMLKVTPVLLAVLLILMTFLMIKSILGFFDDNKSSNPYSSTANGTEAINGQVPPGMIVQVKPCKNEYDADFKFTVRESQNMGGYEFLMPLNDDNRKLITDEYGTSATMILKIAELLGNDGVLSVMDDGISVIYSDNANVDQLTSEIMAIIGNSG